MSVYGAARDALHYRTAHELIDLYRSGALSPVEATEASLARITAVNGRVNAVYFVDREAALTAAAAAEARWRRGAPRGLLDGVPILLKDSVAVAGMPSYDGSRAVELDDVWDTVDAPLTARLKEHGAVIVAKTTMPDFGMIASGVSGKHGITRNPWDLRRNSGGSSSGSGAALAVGMAPIAIGTDIGGSVRIPSAFCGTFGLKPSEGRVPLEDPVPWLVAGPMTRSVADAALVMNVIAQPDPRDFTALPYDGCDYLDGIDAGVDGKRVGVLPDIGFGLPVDPQILDMLRAAARTFERLGAVVEPVAPLFEHDPEPDFDRCVHARSYLEFSQLTPAQAQSVLPVIADWCRRISAESALELMQSMVNVQPIRRQALAPFARCDYLLTPTMAVLPYAAELPWPPGGTAHNPFCFPFNMSGQPAASINGGFSREGLPMGLQIVGRRYDDRGVLRAARAFEQATEHHRCHPTL
jgi:aspartyl-tRNA(Asn)/glutamyl-tRNA(Gln) amidotransferase subunit A